MGDRSALERMLINDPVINPPALAPQQAVIVGNMAANQRAGVAAGANAADNVDILQRLPGNIANAYDQAPDLNFGVHSTRLIQAAPNLQNRYQVSETEVKISQVLAELDAANARAIGPKIAAATHIPFLNGNIIHYVGQDPLLLQSTSFNSDQPTVADFNDANFIGRITLSYIDPLGQWINEHRPYRLYKNIPGNVGRRIRTLCTDAHGNLVAMPLFWIHNFGNVYIALFDVNIQANDINIRTASAFIRYTESSPFLDRDILQDYIEGFWDNQAVLNTFLDFGIHGLVKFDENIPYWYYLTEPKMHQYSENVFLLMQPLTVFVVGQQAANQQFDQNLFDAAYEGGLNQTYIAITDFEHELQTRNYTGAVHEFDVRNRLGQAQARLAQLEQNIAAAADPAVIANLTREKREISSSISKLMNFFDELPQFQSKVDIKSIYSGTKIESGLDANTQQQVINFIQQMRNDPFILALPIVDPVNPNRPDGNGPFFNPENSTVTYMKGIFNGFTRYTSTLEHELEGLNYPWELRLSKRQHFLLNGHFQTPLTGNIDNDYPVPIRMPLDTIQLIVKLVYLSKNPLDKNALLGLYETLVGVTVRDAPLYTNPGIHHETIRASLPEAAVIPPDVPEILEDTTLASIFQRLFGGITQERPVDVWTNELNRLNAAVAVVPPPANLAALQADIANATANLNQATQNLNNATVEYQNLQGVEKDKLQRLIAVRNQYRQNMRTRGSYIYPGDNLPADTIRERDIHRDFQTSDIPVEIKRLLSRLKLRDTDTPDQQEDRLVPVVSNVVGYLSSPTKGDHVIGMKEGDYTNYLNRLAKLARNLLIFDEKDHQSEIDRFIASLAYMLPRIEDMSIYGTCFVPDILRITVTGIGGTRLVPQNANLVLPNQNFPLSTFYYTYINTHDAGFPFAGFMYMQKIQAPFVYLFDKSRTPENVCYLVRSKAKDGNIRNGQILVSAGEVANAIIDALGTLGRPVTPGGPLSVLLQMLGLRLVKKVSYHDIISLLSSAGLCVYVNSLFFDSTYGNQRQFPLGNTIDLLFTTNNRFEYLSVFQPRVYLANNPVTVSDKWTIVLNQIRAIKAQKSNYKPRFTQALTFKGSKGLLDPKGVDQFSLEKGQKIELNLKNLPTEFELFCDLPAIKEAWQAYTKQFAALKNISHVGTNLLTPYDREKYMKTLYTNPHYLTERNICRDILLEKIVQRKKIMKELWAIMTFLMDSNENPDSIKIDKTGTLQLAPTDKSFANILTNLTKTNPYLEKHATEIATIERHQKSMLDTLTAANIATNLVINPALQTLPEDVRREYINETIKEGKFDEVKVPVGRLGADGVVLQQSNWDAAASNISLNTDRAMRHLIGKLLKQPASMTDSMPNRAFYLMVLTEIDKIKKSQAPAGLKILPILENYMTKAGEYLNEDIPANQDLTVRQRYKQERKLVAK